MDSLKIHVKVNLEIGSPFARTRERQLNLFPLGRHKNHSEIEGHIAIGGILSFMSYMRYVFSVEHAKHCMMVG
jgi:hypothetical protein